MILQSLSALYDTLAKQGKVPQEGWSNKPISGVIYLSSDGAVQQIVNIQDVQKDGKLTPRMMVLPDWGYSNPNGIQPDFAFGSSAYVFGLSAKAFADKERLAKSVESAWSLHHNILDGVKDPAVDALLLYFDRLKGGERIDAKMVSFPTALTVGNFAFRFNMQWIHEIPAVKEAWDSFYQQLGNGKEASRCLVTGEVAPIARTHPHIVGLCEDNKERGLTTYNAKSFCSYGYDQNLNAPVCRHAAYAYTQALMYLLSNPKYYRSFGKDLTVVWWPENADEDCGELILGSVFGGKESAKWTDEDISNMLYSLSMGHPVGNIEPDCKFYVMGLSPNSSRIIVRFFRQDTFGAILKNVMGHYQRLELVGDDDKGTLTAARAFRAMVRDDVNKELPEPVIRGYFETVLFGRQYPVQMFSLTHRRIQVGSEDTISHGSEDTIRHDYNEMIRQRTALIKAYYLQTLSDDDDRKECFAVGLLEDNKNPGYVLGRMFAVYEAAQVAGRGGKPWHDIAPIHPMIAAAMSTPMSFS